MYNEMYRPQFHFTPAKGWMNDPNGLVYFNGEYHLFYQYNPHSINWDSMHWGHAVSTDLLTWKHLPIAYEPEGPIDDYFSGSAIVDEKNLSGLFAKKGGIVTIFTHRDAGVQEQSIGYSEDGRKFHRYPSCVLKNPGKEDFRDPKVIWNEKRKCFMMALAVYNQISFYTSSDLKSWDYLSSFGQIHGSHQGVWECPDMFELPVEGKEERRWVLLVGDQGASKTQYFVGHFEGKNFVSDNPRETKLWLDDGMDNYAGQTYSNLPDNRRILIAWMNSTFLFNCTPTSPWRSVYTIPRELSLHETENGIRIFQRPISELYTLRQEVIRQQDVSIENSQTICHLAPQMDIELSMNVAKSSAIQMGIKLCSGEKQEIVVGYDVARQVLYIDRSLSGNVTFAPNFPPHLEASLAPEEGKIKLRILMDHSTLEVFSSDGRVAISALVFPDPAQDTIKFYARKGKAVFDLVEIYPVKSLWNEK